MAIHKIPVVASKGSSVIGEPFNTIIMDGDQITIVFDYKLMIYLDMNSPELGFMENDRVVKSEFTMSKSAIKLISLIRDEDNEVFSVGFDCGNAMYEISLFFKSLKEAKKMKDIITDWWKG